MKREELLEKKMIVGDLDGDSVVKFLKKYGIEYYNIQECKTNWISINKNGEVAYYLRENGFNQCAYPEIDLGDIIYQDMINSLLLYPNQPKPAEEYLLCVDGAHELIDERAKNVRYLINEACKKTENKDEKESYDALNSPEVTITVEYLDAEKEARKEKNRNTKEEFYKACRKAENEGRLINGELYIDGKKYASIELHETEDIARWKEAEVLNEKMKRINEEVKNNCVSCTHEIFSRQVEKQQEDLLKAMGKFARYEKVLVRANTKMPWLGHIFVSKNGPYYECANGGKYLYCIPFDPEKLGRVTE